MRTALYVSALAAAVLMASPVFAQTYGKLANEYRQDAVELCASSSDPVLCKQTFEGLAVRADSADREGTPAAIDALKREQQKAFELYKKIVAKK